MLNYVTVITYTNDLESFSRAIKGIKPLYNNLVIIDNSINKPIKNLYQGLNVYETPVHFTCSQSFNCCQDIARDYNADVLIMAHGDIEIVNQEGLVDFLSYLESFEKGPSGVFVGLHMILYVHLIWIVVMLLVLGIKE